MTEKHEANSLVKKAYFAKVLPITADNYDG